MEVDSLIVISKFCFQLSHESGPHESCIVGLTHSSDSLIGTASAATVVILSFEF